ncbi:MAG: hypothetical protein KAZ36_07675 [Bacteroidales bacterium]|nr:hypothetical protein [Bacteroidales bacterium]
MKTIFSILLGFFVSLCTVSGQVDSVKFINKNCGVVPNSLILTSDSCYLIFTITTDSLDYIKRDRRPDVNHYDFNILKVDKSGTLLSEIRLRDNNSYDRYPKVLKSKNNFIYLTGLKHYKDGKEFLKLIKLDSNGNNIIWDTTSRFGSFLQTNVRYDITKDKQGNLVCFYLINDSITEFGKDHLYIKKFNEDGHVILSKKIEKELIYQADIRFIQNQSDDNCFYIQILKDTPPHKNYDSILNVDLISTKVRSYEILKIDYNGNIINNIAIPVQNELEINFYNKNKQFVGYASNDFFGVTVIKNFNPLTSNKYARVDSSYLSLIFYDSIIQHGKEKLIDKTPLRYVSFIKYRLIASNIVKGIDNSYAFLYLVSISDSIYYHFVKTDLDGNILFDKEIHIDPYVFEGVSFLAEENGFVMIGASRKINERYTQHIPKLRMIKLDLNGKMKTF